MNYTWGLYQENHMNNMQKWALAVVLWVVAIIVFVVRMRSVFNL